MTEITIYHNQDHEIQRFTCSGHAEYDEYGKDVVCASISMLVINTINSIETFTSCEFTCEAEEESGEIDFQFTDEITQDAALLIDAMVLGLQSIQENYGNEYIILDFKEV